MYLTARQRELYEFLQDYIARKGEAPTYQEIGKALRLRSTRRYSRILALPEQPAAPALLPTLKER